MANSITLWKRNPHVSSDEAGNTITSYSLPGYITGPYELSKESPYDSALTYIPSLQSLCIRQLIPFPDQVHSVGDFRLPYKPPESPGDYDILAELIPEFSYAAEARDISFLKHVDPRLWAILVQLYTGLPEVFRTYNIPLSDVHVPLLQQIPPTPRFTLVTILALYGCENVHDDTILELRDLHGLAVLNVGGTALSSWGITRLSKLLRRIEDKDYDSGRRLLGPWELRILSLRNCMNVDDDVYQGLKSFPLLSVVDLRGTQCSPASYRTSGFRPSQEHKLFYPTPLQASLMHLAHYFQPSTNSSVSIPGHTPALYPHTEPFYLCINTLNHTPTSARRIPVRGIGLMDDFRHRSRQGKRAVFTPDNMHDRIWTVPTTPSGRRTTSDFEAIAELEARRYNSEASALQFYMAYSSRNEALPVLADLPKFHRSAHNPTKPSPRPLTGLTLFREPRPWSDLACVSDAHSVADPCKKKTFIPAKRPRSEIDEALMGASEAKRKGHAQTAVKALLGMVERRKSAPEPSSRPKIAIEVSNNPFLRRKPTMQGILDQGLLNPSPREQSASTPNVSSKEDVIDSTPQTAEKSVFHIPPPTARPLRPISTLSVPSLPPETRKVKSKPSSTKLPRSVDSARQMTLSEFLGGATKASKTTSPAVRGSANAAPGNSASSAKFSSVVGHVSDSTKDAGRSVQHDTRRQKGS